MAGMVEESGTVEGECALPLCTSVIFSWKMKVMISFVNWFELYLMQRETKSAPELPVGVSELRPMAAFFVRNGQQCYRALAVFAFPVNFGLDAFPGGCWAWLWFFFFFFKFVWIREPQRLYGISSVIVRG